jgi:hypothetical protein
LGFKLILDDFAEPGCPTTPYELAETVAIQLRDRRSRESPPRRRKEQSDARYHIVLRDWLLQKMTDLGRECWVVIDGCHLPGVSAALHDLIEALVIRVPDVSDWLRIVLLGHRQPLPRDVNYLVQQENLNPFGRKHVSQYLTKLFGPMPEPDLAACLDRICISSQNGEQDRLPTWANRLRDEVLARTQKPLPLGKGA